MSEAESPSSGGDRSERRDTTVDLPEFLDPPDDPMPLLCEWIDSADALGARDSMAFTLATVDERARPTIRTVLLKWCDPSGLVFGTNYGSQKGCDLERTPYAAGSLYWREISRQINMGGSIQRTTESESDRVFMERARLSRAAAIISRQSAVLDDEQRLRDAVASLDASDDPLLRPTWWGGLRLTPEWIEFWHGRRDRLHRRLRYDLESGVWSHRRLQP